MNNQWNYKNLFRKSFIMIKKIILKIRLLFAKTYVAIDIGDKDNYPSKCYIKKVGDKIYIKKIYITKTKE